MRPRDQNLGRQLEHDLLSFEATTRELPGIRNPDNRRVLIEQLLESIHRVKFPAAIRNRNISSRRANPSDELFDPLKAAFLHQRSSNFDEAFWLIFLFVYFGKNPRGGWRYLREIYGRLGDGSRWDWATTSLNPDGFREWLDSRMNQIARKEVAGGFGNHRKYESLVDVGIAVEDYVAWVRPPRTHEQLIQEVLGRNDGDPLRAFDDLYRSMKIHRLGRTGKFDYLTMLGKSGLAPIEPPSTYMTGSTGPLKGARFLFGTNDTARTLDGLLIELNSQLNVGMQVIEDALCNWQKSPGTLERFRG